MPTMRTQVENQSGQSKLLSEMQELSFQDSKEEKIRSEVKESGGKMKSVKVTITTVTEKEYELPEIPTRLHKAGEPSYDTDSIKDIPEAELRQIGETWVEELIQVRRELIEGFVEEGAI